MLKKQTNKKQTKKKKQEDKSLFALTCVFLGLFIVFMLHLLII